MAKKRRDRKTLQHLLKPFRGQITTEFGDQYRSLHRFLNGGAVTVTTLDCIINTLNRLYQPFRDGANIGLLERTLEKPLRQLVLSRLLEIDDVSEWAPDGDASDPDFVIDFGPARYGNSEERLAAELLRVYLKRHSLPAYGYTVRFGLSVSALLCALRLADRGFASNPKNALFVSPCLESFATQVRSLSGRTEPVHVRATRGYALDQGQLTPILAHPPIPGFPVHEVILQHPSPTTGVATPPEVLEELAAMCASRYVRLYVDESLLPRSPIDLPSASCHRVFPIILTRVGNVLPALEQAAGPLAAAFIPDEYGNLIDSVRTLLDEPDGAPFLSTLIATAAAGLDRHCDGWPRPVRLIATRLLTNYVARECLAAGLTASRPDAGERVWIGFEPLRVNLERYAIHGAAELKKNLRYRAGVETIEDHAVCSNESLAVALSVHPYVDPVFKCLLDRRRYGKPDAPVTEDEATALVRDACPMLRANIDRLTNAFHRR